MNATREQPIPTPRPGWEMVVAEAMDTVAYELSRRFDSPDAGAIGTEAIKAVRVALGDTPTDVLVARMEEASRGDDEAGRKDLDGIPGLIRVAIESSVPDWSSPGRAESIMAVAQRTIERNFRGRLANAARMLAFMEYQWSPEKGMGQRQAMIDTMMGHARDAIANNEPARVLVAGETGGVYASPAAALRSFLTVFDLDDPTIVRSLLKLIEGAVRDELTRAQPGTSPGFTAGSSGS